MKRNLPQWLLDVTNSNGKGTKQNSTKKTRKNSNESDDGIENQPKPHSNPTSPQTDQIQNNGTINVVPLANLLSPSRGGVVNNESAENIQTCNDELQTTESSSAKIVTMPLPVVIKTEKADPIESSTSNVTNGQQVVIKQEIKDEPMDTSTSNVTPATHSPVPQIKDEKPARRSCDYGIKCFRRNPGHRSELAHPGDADYRRPSLPSAPIGTPPCPWGAACYRRNPQHFVQLSHPPATSVTTASTTTASVNVVPKLDLPQRRNRTNTGNNRMVASNDYSDEDDYDLEDPFIDDGSSDEYVPDENDDDDLDDTQELTDS